MQSPAWEGDWPISQWFGVNPAAYAWAKLAGHNGVDIAMPTGTPLYLPVAGRVVEVLNDPGGWGYGYKLSTPDNQDWLMAHFVYPPAVREGNEYDAGELAGYSGSTGNSTGPHLHIGWRLWNAAYNRGWPFNGYVDPRQTLDRLQGGLWPPI
jgi:murein DD-endopeptidase MepM/ murein hydrolase activator NlpD